MSGNSTVRMDGKGLKILLEMKAKQLGAGLAAGDPAAMEELVSLLGPGLGVMAETNEAVDIRLAEQSELTGGQKAAVVRTSGKTGKEVFFFRVAALPKGMFRPTILEVMLNEIQGYNGKPRIDVRVCPDTRQRDVVNTAETTALIVLDLLKEEKALKKDVTASDEVLKAFVGTVIDRVAQKQSLKKDKDGNIDTRTFERAQGGIPAAVRGFVLKNAQDLMKQARDSATSTAAGSVESAPVEETIAEDVV